MDSGVADFGLVEKDMLLAIMTITAGLIRVPYEASLGLFLLILSHIKSSQVSTLHTNTK